MAPKVQIIGKDDAMWPKPPPSGELFDVRIDIKLTASGKYEIEKLNFTSILMILRPELGAHRASKGPPWETPFPLCYDANMLTI